MKERGLLFTPELAQAIFEGRKTQTRRPVKRGSVRSLYVVGPHPGHLKPWPSIDRPKGSLMLPCPYGMPGDRIWVRETWQGPLFYGDEDVQDENIHKPDFCVYLGRGDKYPEVMDLGRDCLTRGWRPSLHMPRWAARSVCEILDVRVERPEDISLADAIAEGFENREAFIASYRARYAQPYCWVITFRRLL